MAPPKFRGYGLTRNRTRTKKIPLEEVGGGCFVSWVLNWESTENWDFHSWEPYTEPYSDTSGILEAKNGLR